MTTFVLVHGGCHGGWCYSRVADLLRAQGHEVHAPTLSGLGERSSMAGELINLSTHVQDVVTILEESDLRDVVLCGHSYGGMVTTGVATLAHERIRTLFYLDACVPDDGQSLLDIAGPERASAFLQLAGETGYLMQSPGSSYFGVNGVDQDWVDEMCTPHPITCFIQKVRLTGNEMLVPNRTYIKCDRHHSSNQATFDRLLGSPGWKMVSIDAVHDLMIDDPQLLADLLLDEVR